ncbi:glutamine--fructose-6-phosphate transaminase (isomerizing) [Maricaulis sp.]|uniref:glutamine--fructose-6-phosphate transaminase (isomerizing) n=1 Tax=Maricaulis sp. TaxID=1486257 RepID=UPI001B16C6F4|nr:glutamine--fructose-6-phosphate transaminase (isomerizing) [Maricaulis sp.]MBO6796515.1 glutamine--fructose-6-phosphate transaminase (isomerizing) [Maricaulis sp.]
MCGIIGIAGTTETSERLIDGLKRLEYRGYDSAGIAVLQEGELQRRRAQGKIRNLESVVRDEPCDGPLGIAHTRWATHGKPSTSNAHPHAFGGVAIVHNGIIENFRELREELAQKGHNFESETDSEVIAHVIAYYLGKGLAMKEAFREAVNRLRGAYAVAAISKDNPDQLYGARRGSPLVIGRAETESFLGSDAIALAEWTRRVIYLEEDDWCMVTPTEVEIYTMDGKRVERPEQISNATPGFADKGEYRHFMEKEIYEQPDAVGRTLSNYIDPVERRFHSANLDGWKSTSRLLGSACGTAFYAAATSKYWFERYARLPVEVDIASEFRYRSPVLLDSDRAFFVSQSGETADTLAALRYCKASNVPTVAVVNVPESSIDRDADTTLFTYAGTEIGVASTKAFTAQLTALACVAAGAAQARDELSDNEIGDLIDGLLEAPRMLNEALEKVSDVEEIARSLSKASDVLYLGRGQFYPLAMEGALKLKEISYIHAEGYAAGELKHGPIALIEEGTPVVVIAPYDELFEKTISNVQEVAARGAEVILITDRKGAKLAVDDASAIIEIPECHPVIQPIVAAVPIQQLAYYTAVLKGTDVDQPRNLAKSVTVE